MKKFITTASLLITLAVAQNNTNLIEQPANRFLYQSFQMLAVLEPSLNDDQARDFILKHGCYCSESAPGLKFAIFPTRAAARAEKSKWAGLARAENQISNFLIKM